MFRKFLFGGITFGATASLSSLKKYVNFLQTNTSGSMRILLILNFYRVISTLDLYFLNDES